MKNNKGQVLIIFIIMIPILMSFIAIIGEAGYLFNLKNKYTNITKEAITFALKEEQNDKAIKTQNYIQANLTGYDELTVTENEGRIRVVLVKRQNSIFTKFIKEFTYTIKLDYVGYKEHNKIIIKD